MEKTRGFDKRDHGLAPIRLGIWAGFIFVCFSDDCPDLATWLGDLPEQFGSYRFETFELVRRRHYDLDCNWKLYIENAMEDYHTPTVHRSSIGLQETDPIRTIGEWDSIHMESEDTIAVLPEDNTHRSRTSKVSRGVPRPEPRSPSSIRRHSSAPRRTACGGCRQSPTVRANAA